MFQTLWSFSSQCGKLRRTSCQQIWAYSSNRKTHQCFTHKLQIYNTAPRWKLDVCVFFYFFCSGAWQREKNNCHSHAVYWSDRLPRPYLNITYKRQQRVTQPSLWSCLNSDHSFSLLPLFSYMLCEANTQTLIYAYYLYTHVRIYSDVTHYEPTHRKSSCKHTHTHTTGSRPKGGPQSSAVPWVKCSKI